MSACLVKTPNVEMALKEIVRSTIAKAFPHIAQPEPLITLGKVSEYQCNNAMGLVKLLAQSKESLKLSPFKIGEMLEANLVENDLIEKFEPTSKGFINVYIRNDWIGKMAEQVLMSGIQPPTVSHQHVLIDFSSPNIAKEMHVGHLRSTIIGECLCRVLEFCGHQVDRINHLGDWGTAFGMLILYLKREFPKYLNETPNISNLTTFYKAAKKCFDEDAQFKEDARLEVVKLQSYTPESIEAWQVICDISRKEFNEIYARLNVHITERGESFYNPLIHKVLKLLDDAGQIEESDGAKLIISKECKKISDLNVKDMTKLASLHLARPLREGGAFYHPNLLEAMRKAEILNIVNEEEIVTLSKKEKKAWSKFDLRVDLDKLMAQLAPLYNKELDPLFRSVFEDAGAINGDNITVPRFTFPLMVVKSDGGFTYDTIDITAMYHRFVVEKVNRNIYCTDLGQYEHFKMVAQVAEDMHWLDNAEWEHVGFGLVTGSDGKKIKTRSGETIRLKELLDEACERSLVILKQREESDRAQGHSKDEMISLSQTIGIGAVKYYDLKQCRTTDYAFSFDKMLDLTGNTAIFLLYQYARMCSIKRKANVTDEELANFSEIAIDTPQEKNLALCAFRFESVVLKTAEDLFPHHLTDFAYELMSYFSDFFQNCKVIGDVQQNSRLCLVELTRITLKKTLELLNINTAERI